MNKNYQLYSDEQLLPLIREAKPICDYAFDTLFNRYGTKLNSYCLFLCRNREAADQIFHDCWVKLFMHIKSGKSITNVMAYLVFTSKHLMIDASRKSARESEHKKLINENFDFQEFVDTGSQSLEKNELIGLIHLAVDSLDEKYKEPFILKKYQELTNEEISAICGESVECVRKRILRATYKVKEFLEPYLKEISDK